MNYHFSVSGHCDICDEETTFSSKFSWFRDHLKCSKCGSIPRERALMRVIKEIFPNFTDLTIHETSPCTRGASEVLKRDCPGYSSSQFFPNIPSGEINPEYNIQSQNLENLNFPNDTFDLFVSQDVMEHLFDPGKAFHEIERVLKPGGAHIFTAPLVNKWKTTELRAQLDLDGNIIHLLEPQYHGNPVNDEGILMTRNWGYDIANFIVEKTKMPTIIMQIDDIESGIRAEYIEVIVSKKK